MLDPNKFLSVVKQIENIKSNHDVDGMLALALSKGHCLGLEAYP